MGLFTRKERTEPRQTFAEAMAAADEKIAARKANDAAMLEQNARQNELVKAATDPAAAEADRDAASAELVALIGEAKASKLIGARSRLVKRGWVR